MSIAATPTHSAWELALATTTVRQFVRALGVAAVLVLAGCGLYLLESHLLKLDNQFIENPADVMMRAIGLPHFLIGLLFMLTSSRIRSRAGLRRVLAAGLAAIACCWLFAYLGGRQHPLLVMLFYGAFLVHEIRDEANIYRSYGDAPPGDAEPPGLFVALTRTAMLLFMTVLAGMSVLRIELTQKRTVLDRGPEWLGPLVAGLVLGLTVVSALRLHWLTRRGGTSVRAVLRLHLPLVLVYLAMLLVLLVGSFMGTTGLNLIILVHVSAWLVYVYHLLSTRRVAVTGLWSWLRGSPTGFLVLHLGLLAIVLALMAVRVHVWQRVGFLSDVLASKNFIYWAMFHIVISFGNGK
jgi:hypothetical protein